MKYGSDSDKNDDDANIATYLKHANVTGYPEREARDVWKPSKF